jgi:hypothetical protein
LSAAAISRRALRLSGGGCNGTAKVVRLDPKPLNVGPTDLQRVGLNSLHHAMDSF